MEDLLKLVITNAPNLLGLVVLAWILWRQNERMLSALLERVAVLEQTVAALKTNSVPSIEGQ